MSQVLFECGPTTNQGSQSAVAVQATPPGAKHTLSAAELLRLKDGVDGAMPFQPIATLALAYFDEVVEDFLGLEGEHRGKRYVSLNPTRGDQNLGSFVIYPESGQFIDFADPDDCKGGDLIALTAYVRACSQSAAADQLLDFLASLEAEVEYPEDQTSGDVVRPASSNPEAGVAAMRPITQILPAFEAQRFVRNGDAVEARYDYTDRSGQLCFAVLRIRKPDGRKSFLPISAATQSDGRPAWTAKMPVGLRPLFGLSRLAGTEPTTTAFVVEGEKAAQALQTLLPNTPVLTSAGGARAASKSDWSPLAGRDVVIWPDNDDAGLNYQQEVIKLIRTANPGTPISTVNVEALFRGVCGLKGWVYDEKATDFTGWDAADVAELHLDATVVATAIEQAVEEFPQSEQAALIESGIDATAIAGVTWNSGKVYRMTGTAVQVQKTTESKTNWTNVCSPLRIVRQLRDKEGAGWSLELVYQASDGAFQTIVLPRARLADSQGLRAELFDKGVQIYNWMELQDYIGHVIPIDTHTLVRGPGWQGIAYVQARQTYGDTLEPLALDATAPACMAFEQRGTLEDWNREVGRYCIGNSRLMLAAYIALAGPLLCPFGVENGGIHLVGSSTIGKTTALNVAASIYGNPNRFILSWRTTSNGLETTLASRNDCVALIDEMGKASPDEAGAAVYMMGNGQGKVRMTRHGLAAHTLTFRLTYMSTGEVPLHQHLGAGRQPVRVGMEVRLLNIPADAGHGYGMFETLHGNASSKVLPDHLREACTQGHGTAGDT